MRASARIRQYASKFATTQPEVAFDLLDLASKVAEDEKADQGGQQEQAKQAQQEGQGQEKDQGQQKQGGELPPALKEHMEEKKKEEGGDKDQGQQDQKQAYSQLKAATIRIAAENPGVRQALLPALKLIKQLG